MVAASRIEEPDRLREIPHRPTAEAAEAAVVPAEVVEEEAEVVRQEAIHLLAIVDEMTTRRDSI